MKGFTLIEIMLTLALFGVVAGITIPVHQSFQNKNDLDISASILAQSMRRAKALSQASDFDTTWGVYVATSTIAVFQGANYTARDSSYDEVFEMVDSISVSGISEIVFAKFTGEPNTTGTTILTSVNNDTKNIVINSKGMVQY